MFKKLTVSRLSACNGNFHSTFTQRLEVSPFLAKRDYVTFLAKRDYWLYVHDVWLSVCLSVNSSSLVCDVRALPVA